jgi:stage II sporulation protein D
VRSRLTVALLVATVLAASACAHRARPPVVAPAPPPASPGVPSAPPVPAAPSGAPLRVSVGGSVRAIPLEDYVAGCVVAELGTPRVDAAAARRARQVQAILCRSYAAAARNRHGADGFDVCAGTHCQVYRAVPATETGRLAREAAADTKGIVLVFDGRAVRPLYHAACGGRTSAAHDVWPGNGVPWLVSVEDDVCAREPGWTVDVDLEQLDRALAGDDKLRSVTPLRDVVVAARDEAGRAASIRLVGRTTLVVRGDEFRMAVLRTLGDRSLPSTLFTIERRRSRLTFDGRGSGHGVGLCQAGAIRLAARGQTPEEILRHYFPGTSLARIGGA